MVTCTSATPCVLHSDVQQRKHLTLASICSFAHQQLRTQWQGHCLRLNEVISQQQLTASSPGRCCHTCAVETHTRFTSSISAAPALGSIARSHGPFSSFQDASISCHTSDTHLTTAEQAVQRYTSVLPADPSAPSAGDGASVPVLNVLRLPQHSHAGLSTYEFSLVEFTSFLLSLVHLRVFS